MIKDEVVKVEDAILLILTSTSRGQYRKSQFAYLFELADKPGWIVAATENAIEFRLKTLKWSPGGYEPVESSELHSHIDYKELSLFTHEERLNRVNLALSRLK